MADSAYWRAVAGAAASDAVSSDAVSDDAVSDDASSDGVASVAASDAVEGAAASDAVADHAVASDAVADDAVARAAQNSKGDLDVYIESQRRKGGEAQQLWRGYKGPGKQGGKRGAGRPASDGFKGLGKQGGYYGAGFVDGYMSAMQESSLRDVERSAYGKNKGKGKRSPSRSRRTIDTGKGVGNLDIGGASYKREPSFIDTGKGVGNLDIGGASYKREPSSIDTGKGVGNLDIGGASYQREPSLAALPSSSSNAHDDTMSVVQPRPRAKYSPVRPSTFSTTNMVPRPLRVWACGEDPPAMRAIIVPAKAFLISAEISGGNVRMRPGTPRRRRYTDEEVFLALEDGSLG